MSLSLPWRRLLCSRAAMFLIAWLMCLVCSSSSSREKVWECFNPIEKSVYSCRLLKWLPQWLFLELQRRIWCNCRERPRPPADDGHTRYAWGWTRMRDFSDFLQGVTKCINQLWEGGNTLGTRLVVLSFASCRLLESKPLVPGWEKLSVDLGPADPGGAA